MSIITYKQLLFDVEKMEVTECSKGIKPKNSHFSQDRKTFLVKFDAGACRKCEQQHECCVKISEVNAVAKVQEQKLYSDKKSINTLYDLIPRETSSADSRFYIERVYREGMNYSATHQFIKAEECYKEVIAYYVAGGQIPFAGGAYVNLAQCYLMNLAYIDIDKQTLLWSFKCEDDIKDCLNKALQIKPTNEVALFAYSAYHFLKGEYSKSIECFFKIDNKLSPNALLVLGHYASLDINVNIPLEAGNLEMLRNPEKIKAYEDICGRYYRSNGYLEHIVKMEYILSTMYYYSGDYLKSYSLNQNILAGFPDFPLAIRQIVSLCSEGMLNRPKEHEKYSLIGLKQLKESKLGKVDKEKDIIFFNENLASAYNQQKKHDQALEVYKGLLPKLKSLTSMEQNTILHNIGQTYHSLKDYDNAIHYLKKAISLQKDEMTYTLMGKVYYDSEDYKEALFNYKEALNFMENENMEFSGSDGAGVSICQPEWYGIKLHLIYLGIIKCYLTNGEFDKASEYLGTANIKWPNDIDLAELEVALSEKIIG